MNILRAARAGNLDRVLMLLKSNVDINTSNAVSAAKPVLKDQIFLAEYPTLQSHLNTVTVDCEDHLS